VTSPHGAYQTSPHGAFIASPHLMRGGGTRLFERDPADGLKLVSVGLILHYGFKNVQSTFGSGWISGTTGTIDCGTKTTFFPTALNHILDAMFKASGWRRQRWLSYVTGIPVGWVGADCDDPAGVTDSDTPLTHPGWDTPVPHPIGFLSDHSAFNYVAGRRDTPRTGWPGDGADPLYYGIFGRNWQSAHSLNSAAGVIDNPPTGTTPGGYQAGVSTIVVKNASGWLASGTIVSIKGRLYRRFDATSLGGGRFSVTLAEPLLDNLAHEDQVYFYTYTATQDGYTTPTNGFEPDLSRDGTANGIGGAVPRTGVSIDANGMTVTFTLKQNNSGPTNAYNSANDGIEEPSKLTPPGVVLFVPELSLDNETLRKWPATTNRPLCAFSIPGVLPAKPSGLGGYLNHQIVALEVIPQFTLRFERAT
jgi:hypothetical protein